MKQINRRSFLKGTAATAAVVATPLMASQKQKDGYRALVCVLLEGGADTVNMIAPKYDLYGYHKYTHFAQELSHSKDKLRTLIGSRYGLHKEMPKMQSLFNYRDMAIVSAVGTLIHPLNKQMLEGSSKKSKLPPQLYSQVAQRELWMMAGKKDSGWAARVADKLGRDHINISVGGQNSMQSGSRHKCIVMNDESFGDVVLPNSVKEQLRKTKLHTAFSYTKSKANRKTLPEQMETVAKLIAARKVLGFPDKQIFFVRHDVWNREALPVDEIRYGDNASVAELDKAIGSFSDAMRELGLYGNVTTMTMGDLSRTLTPDGYGTNRGWAGNMFVAGGAVRSGIYGMPVKQEPNSPDMLPNRAVIPKISSDQYLATAVDWLCEGSIDLEELFPNLSNFKHQTIGYLS